MQGSDCENDAGMVRDPRNTVDIQIEVSVGCFKVPSWECLVCFGKGKAKPTRSSST